MGFESLTRSRDHNMNHKYLEIWLRFRKRKHDRDLLEMQNNFAERGLAFSSVRERAEKSLADDFKDEMDMEIEKSNVYEKENEAINLERRNSILTNRILAIVAVSSMIFSWLATQRAGIEFELRTRPYLTIENVEGNTDLVSKKSDYRIFIKNSGNLPARILYQAMDCPSKEPPTFVSKNDVIGINQSIVKSISLQGGEDMVCSLTIKYNAAIAGFPEKTYETQQNFLYKFGEQMGSGGGYMK